MSTEPAERGSARSDERKEKILAELTLHMGRRARTRRIVKAGAVLCVFWIGLMYVAWGMFVEGLERSKGGGERVVAEHRVDGDANVGGDDREEGNGEERVIAKGESVDAVTRMVLEGTMSRVEIATNEKGIVERLAMGGKVGRDGGASVVAEKVGDDELLRMLEEAGVEDGLIRIGGRLQLARDVVQGPVLRLGEPRSEGGNEGGEGDRGLGVHLAVAGSGVEWSGGLRVDGGDLKPGT
jgi:hypothetical protein